MDRPYGGILPRDIDRISSLFYNHTIYIGIRVRQHHKATSDHKAIPISATIIPSLYKRQGPLEDTQEQTLGKFSTAPAAIHYAMLKHVAQCLCTCLWGLIYC